MADAHQLELAFAGIADSVLVSVNHGELLEVRELEWGWMPPERRKSKIVSKCNMNEDNTPVCSMGMLKSNVPV